MLPGHGLACGCHRGDGAETIAAIADHFGCTLRLPPIPAGDPDRLFPDLSPDRFGSYLTTAWSIARARVLFDPWYETDAAHARAFTPADLAPERLAVAHRALLNASAARAYLIGLRAMEESHGNS